MANRYWVGGGSAATWHATGNTNWGTASGTRDNAAVPTASDDVIFDNHAYSTDSPCTIGAAFAYKTLNFTGWTNTLTIGAFTGSGAGSALFVSGMTLVVVATSRLTFTANATLTTGTRLMPNISCTGGTLTLGDNCTMADIKTLDVTLSGTALNLAGFILSGYSSTSRLLVQSSVLGTPKTITGAGGTFANCDFRDIAFANGGSNLDLSAITGLSGDCGGNGMSGGGALTLTAPLPTTWTNTNGGYWSLYSNWSEGRVPLPQDNPSGACAFGASKTVHADMPRLGKTIDWTGATGSPTFTLDNDVTFYGGLNLTGTGSFGGSFDCIFESCDRAGTQYITRNGRSFGGNVKIFAVGEKLQLADSLLLGNNLYVWNGEFIDAGYSVACYTFDAGNSSATRAVIKTGNWTITRNSGTGFYNVSSGLTWSDTAGSITLSDTGASAKTFAGGGLSYNNLIIAGGGSGAVSVTGANTFTNFSVGYPKQIIFQHGVQQTFTNLPVFAGIDNPTKIISGSTLNGDMDTAGSGHPFANWAETTAGSSTLTRDTTVFNSGTSSAKFVVDGSQSYTGIAQTVLTVGKRYKAILYAKCNAGGESVNAGDSGYVVPGGFYNVLTTSFAKYIGFFTPGVTAFSIKRTTLNQTFWIDDVILEESTAIELSSDLAGSPATLSCPGKFNYLQFCSVKDIIGKSGEVWVAGNSTDVSGNSGILFYTLAPPFFHVDMSGGFGG